MVSEPGYPWRKSRAMGIKNPKFLPVLAADRPSSFSGYGGAPADRPYSFSSYGGAPVDRPYSFSGYGGGPNRSVVKVPDIVPGKIPNPAPISGKITKSMVRYEAVASDPTAVWRIASATNYKTDMVQHKRGDFQKVMAGMHESLNRIEELVQKLVSSQTRDLPDLVPPAEWENEKTRRSEDLKLISLNSTQGTQLRNTPEGNFNSPPNGYSVVVTGWGDYPLPHAVIASPTLNNMNPSHGTDKHACIEEDDLNTLNKQVRHFTGFGNTPMVYPLKPVIEEIQKSAEETKANILDEAQFDLTQLYMVGRAVKRLRCTGLFWKLPPWPDFCIEELTAVYKSELMKMRHEVEEERMMLQMTRVWRVERVQRKLVVAKLTVDSKYAPLNKLQSDLEEFLSFHRGNSVDEEIHKSAEEGGDSRIAKKCLGMLKAMRSHHENNDVAYRKGIGVVCDKKGGFGVDDRWLWSTGLLWNLPPWPDLSLCEADWRAIEKGAAAMCLRMAAMFGGIVGQEVVQACSRKFHPVYQFSYFGSVESLPVEPLESGDLKSENTRYTAQISVLRSKFRRKLEQAKIFMVGSGALGCEVLKNLALMGISCSPDGKLTVTDDDVMEKSNLSRQFLFHDWNSGQPKSTVAATVVMAINSRNYVEAQMLPKSHYCYLIRLTLEYCKFSSLDADEITKESRRRLSNSFGKIRYCLNDVGRRGASEAIRISIEKGQKKGWLKGASDATYQESDANGLCLFAEISALHMKVFEEVLHLIVKRLQQEMEHLSYYTVPCLTGGSSSIDVLEVVGQNYSDFVLNITSKKLKPGVPSDKNPQDVTSGTNNSDSQKCNSEQIYSANGVASQDINSTDEHIGDCKVESSVFPLSSEDTISETRYPADNWNSCQFALSNGSPVHNNQSVPQSGLSYGDNDLSYIDWPGIDNFEEDNTLFRCDSTYGQQQLENTEELSLILSSSDAIYSSDVALQPGFEPSYSDYGILDDLSAFNGIHDKLYTVVELVKETGMIHGYGFVSKMDEAVKLFDGMVLTGWNAFIYSTLLDGYCKEGRTEDATTLFKEMLGKGINPGAITYIIMLDCFFTTWRTAVAKEFLKSLKVIYKLQLPEGVGIYPVFNVSQLKIHCDSKAISSPDLSLESNDSKLKAEPNSVLENSVVTQWLIPWKSLPPDDASWEDTNYFKGTFPWKSLPPDDASWEDTNYFKGTFPEFCAQTIKSWFPDFHT